MRRLDQAKCSVSLSCPFSISQDQIKRESFIHKDSVFFIVGQHIIERKIKKAFLKIPLML